MADSENKRKPNLVKFKSCLINEKHEIYFDEKANDWYCKDHEEELLKDGYNTDIAKENSRLESLNKGHLLNQIEYKKDSEPLDKRKKIDNESLKDLFVDRLVGRTLRVSVLKQIFEGKVKINDTDTSTTVVSSAIMRRLSRLTGYKWHQERLKGSKDNEPLVKFTKGPEKYKSPKQLKQERLDLYIAEGKVSKKLDVLESEKDDVESGYVETMEGEGMYFPTDEKKSETLEIYKAEIKELKKLLGIKEDSDVSSQDTEEKK